MPRLIPFTFSITIHFGFISEINLICSSKRSSTRCFVSEYFFIFPQYFSRLPEIEKLAQGGEPSKISSSPFFNPIRSSISLPVTFRISFSITGVSGKFNL